MSFELLYFRDSDKILRKKKMGNMVLSTMRYLDDCLQGTLYRGELLRQALSDMDWRQEPLSILDGRRYQYKGLRNGVAIDGSFSSYEYIQDALLRLQVGFDKKKIEMGIKYTDGEFWQILDFNFLEGRGYTVQEVENREPLAVINQRLKEQYFGDQPAVGKYLEVTGTNFRIAGVVENVSIIRIMPYADIWVPLGFSKTDINKISITSNSFPGWYAMVLAHSRKDFPGIKSEFQQHLKQVEFPDERYSRILTNTTSYQEALARQLFRREDNNLEGLLIVLFVLMLIFMLLPTINLVNINISRILERSSEIGVRKSFGASSWSLVGQFLVENILISLIGGLISLLLATIILGLVNRSGIILIPVSLLTTEFFWPAC